MTVTVRFMGGYSSITGERKAMFSLPKGITVQELLDILSKKYGPSFENRVWIAERKLAPGFKLFLGEEEIFSSGLDTKVNGDVTLFFLEGMAGGS